MKVLNAKVNWSLGWNNDPSLEILVDRIPRIEDLRYDFKGGMFFGESGGFVHFLAHNGDEEKHDGYGGASFFVIMKDETRKEIKGPWSGRSGVTNLLGFTPCVEVFITDNSEDFNGGFFYSGAITIELAKEAVDEFTKAKLLPVIKFENEPYWKLQNFEGECSVCKGFKEYSPIFPSDKKIETCRWCGGTGLEKDHVERR